MNVCMIMRDIILCIPSQEIIKFALPTRIDEIQTQIVLKEKKLKELEKTDPASSERDNLSDEIGVLEGKKLSIQNAPDPSQKEKSEKERQEIKDLVLKWWKDDEKKHKKVSALTFVCKH